MRYLASVHSGHSLGVLPRTYNSSVLRNFYKIEIFIYLRKIIITIHIYFKPIYIDTGTKAERQSKQSLGSSIFKKKYSYRTTDRSVQFRRVEFTCQLFNHIL